MIQTSQGRINRMPSSGRRRRSAFSPEDIMISRLIQHLIDDELAWENYIDILSGLADNY